MWTHARTVRVRAAESCLNFPPHLGHTLPVRKCTLTRCESGSDVVLKCTAKMRDHVRLLSFSSASSAQAPVLTAPNQRCMVPSAVVVHREDCFAARARRTEPPEMSPTDRQQIATGLTSPCPSREEHGPFYGTQGRQQLTYSPMLQSHLLSHFN